MTARHVEGSGTVSLGAARLGCEDESVGNRGQGLPGSTSCPDGQVAVGITGREGDFVDDLALRCRNADGSGLIATSLGFGGGLGTADGPYDCPEGTVLTGLEGQSVFEGQTIRYVQIVCSGAVPPDGDGDDDNDGIRDTAPPIDKAQCRQAGWAMFNNPAFRNHGECVSYVATRQ